MLYRYLTQEIKAFLLRSLLVLQGKFLWERVDYFGDFPMVGQKIDDFLVVTNLVKPKALPPWVEANRSVGSNHAKVEIWVKQLKKQKPAQKNMVEQTIN